MSNILNILPTNAGTGSGEGETWGVPPQNVSNLSLVAENETITIKWKDPADSYVDGVLLSEWKGTKLVQKSGAYSENPTDGVLLVDNQERDRYATSGFKINGLTNGETYYFSLYPYSSGGLTNTEEVNRVSGAPINRPPGDVTNLAVKTGNGEVTLTWNDPQDTTVEGAPVTWAGTKVIYKIGSYPTNINDGTLAVDNKVRDQYASNGLTIQGLTNNTTYYFKLFTYSTTNGINNNVANNITATPVPYRVMTIVINLANSNPDTCCTYADDATSLSPKDAAWDEFFGYKPCLFKNGQVVDYLNPNDFTQFEGGGAADITSGNAGDVMIEFPLRGLKISKSGQQITVSMTDKPDAEAEGFKYYAHMRGSTKQPNFYMGAYKGYVTGGKLRSLSGKSPTVDTTIGEFRNDAQANGNGYQQSGFQQLTYRQAMFILKYRSLNSQSALGFGWTNCGGKRNTGSTDKNGMNSGVASSVTPRNVKVFGVEDMWGNIYEWIDGLFCDSSRNIMVTTTNNNFNNTGSGYTNAGKFTTSNISGYINNVSGNTEAGFVPIDDGGSSTTYFSDYGYLRAGSLPRAGGYWNNGSAAGAFYLSVS